MRKILGFKEFLNEQDISTGDWQADKANRFSGPSGRNYAISDPPYSMNSRIRGESKMIHKLHSLRNDPHLNYMVASQDYTDATPVIDYISNKITGN
jgi:hypothetical protein